MTTYGYIRTSKEHTEGVAGMDPEAQALQLRTAGVTAENIYRDLGVSGSLGANTRTGWHRLDGRLAQGGHPGGSCH